MSYSNDRRIAAEKTIVRALVKAGLSAALTVSVNDGEEWTVKRSDSFTDIIKALMTTDGDFIVMRDKDGIKVSWFHLVYGNDGYDVIADYTDNEATNTIMATIAPVIDKLESALAY